MKHLAIVLLSAAMALAPVVASATVFIHQDQGGNILQYLAKYTHLYKTGERVIIDGECDSACTMVLGLPRQQYCATREARFGFHSGFIIDDNGDNHDSPAWTQVMALHYPSAVQQWLASKGGISSRPLILRGAEMAAIVPICP